MDYPVSDEVYNMLSILTNQLQALEAYDRYSKDMDSDGRDLVKRIAQDDRQHVEQLINQLETHIRANGMRPKK